MFVHYNNKDYYNSDVGSPGKPTLPRGGKWSLGNNCLLPEGPQLKLHLSTHNVCFFVCFYSSSKLLSRVIPVLHVRWDTCRRFTNIQVQWRAGLIAQGMMFTPQSWQRLNPAAQRSFPLTSVGLDSRSLPDTAKCQFTCVPSSTRCHCKSTARGGGPGCFTDLPGLLSMVGP